MKKVIILTLFVLSFWFSLAAPWLSSKEFEIWKEIEINWDWFGEYWLYSYLCFNSNDSCFWYQNTWIISWTDTRIVFKVPLSAAVWWELLVYNAARVDPSRYLYKVKPVILGIFNDQWGFAKRWCNDEIISIVWVWFWNSFVWWGWGSKVIIGDSDMEVEKWSHETKSSILKVLGYWIADDFIKTITVNLKVKEWKILWGLFLQNSAWLGSFYQEFSLYWNLTNDKYSCLQDYNYVIWMDKIFFSWKKLWDWIVVAVIDDWINHNHLDFKGKLWINSKEIPNNNIDDDKNGFIDDVYWWNFARNSNRMDAEWWHWTMVAWIIAAEKDNGIWISWIAPNAKIMPLIVFESWEIDVAYIIKAIKYAVDNWAKVINLSLWWKYTDSYSAKFDSIISYAYKKWAVIVSSSWNGDYTHKQDRDLDIYKSSPVCNDWNWTNYVLWVWSTDNNWVKAEFSDYWSCVDVSTPWIDIVSLSHSAFSEYNIPYDKQSWTSFSAPMVAAAVAVLWSNNTELTNQQIYDMVKNHWNSIDDKNPAYVWKLWKILNIPSLLNYPVPEKQTLQLGNKKDHLLLEPLNDFQSILNWMHSNWLTKFNVVEEFNPKSNITREQAAKFFTQFGKLLNLTKKDALCEFKDISEADYSLIPYIIESCNYSLLKWSNWFFRPFDNITKAEALTVVIRSLKWFQNEDMDPWYLNYFNEAKNLWITKFNLNELWENITREDMWMLVYNAANTQ